MWVASGTMWAAATGLLDARTRTWSPAVAHAAGIDPALLPHLTSDAGEVAGRTDEAAHALLGVPTGTPIVLAPGDAGAATLGITGLAPGQDHASLGASGWIASVRRAVEDLAADGVSDRAMDNVPTSTPNPASHRLALGGGTDLHISALLAAGAAAAWARRAYLSGADATAADRCSRPVSVSAAVGRRACWCCPHSSGSGSPSGMMPCAARCSASTPPPARPTSTPRPSTGLPWPSSMRSKPAMAMVLATLVVLVVRTVLGRCCQWSAGKRSPLPGGGSGDCGGCCRRLAG